MLVRALAPWSVLFLAIGCDSAPAGRTAPAKPANTAQQAATPAQRAADAHPGRRSVGKFGARLSGAHLEPLATVFAEPAKFSGKTVTVDGYVRRTCSKMGCWMELSESADPKTKACRVIMKNHKFFVPTDSTGHRARVEGVFEARRVEAGQVTHMEREGGEFPNKAADGSAEELRFVADGVEIFFDT